MKLKVADRMVLAISLALAVMMCFSNPALAKGGQKAKSSPAASKQRDPNICVMLSKVKPVKNYKKIGDQNVASVGGYGLYFQGKKAPLVILNRDSALQVSYDLPPDASRWITGRRQFVKIVSLKDCDKLKFSWQVSSTGNAIFRLTICDIAQSEDFGKTDLYRTWSSDFEYLLPNTKGDLNESTVTLKDLRSMSSYGGHQGDSLIGPNLDLVVAYEFTVFVPPKKDGEYASFTDGANEKGKFIFGNVWTVK